MTGWIVRRLAIAVVTVLAATIVLIALLHLLPGDPLAVLIGDHPADPAVVAALRTQWGTNRTLWQTIAAFFGGVAHGDLGVSLSEQQPVIAVLRQRIGPTLLLGALTLLIDFTVGLALGLWAALRPRSWRARLASGITIAGYAMPAFAVGLVLVWIFAVHLRWFPAAGFADPLLSPDAPAWTVVHDRLRHLVLPLTTLVIASIAVPLRQQRSAVLGTAGGPWVLAARARGTGPWRIAWKHCWRPALVPIVTLFGLWLPLLVTGAVFVEVVFAWPGIGSLLAQATVDRDVPLVIGAGILWIVMVQLGSLIADLLYHVVDPEQRAA